MRDRIEYHEQPIGEANFPEMTKRVDNSEEFGKEPIVKEQVTCSDDSCKYASGSPQDMHSSYLYRYGCDGGTMELNIAKP